MRHFIVGMILLQFFCMSVLSVAPVYAAKGKEKTAAAKKILSPEEQKAKDLNTYMKLRSKLKEKIRETERNKINFAMSEYYYKLNDFFDAERSFEEFRASNPTGITALLTNVYLCKLAQKSKNETKILALKKDMFQDQFILLFTDHKVISYDSLFDNHYEIHYFVDKIEIFLNGEIFDQISP